MCGLYFLHTKLHATRETHLTSLCSDIMPQTVNTGFGTDHWRVYRPQATTINKALDMVNKRQSLKLRSNMNIFQGFLLLIQWSVPLKFLFKFHMADQWHHFAGSQSVSLLESHWRCYSNCDICPFMLWRIDFWGKLTNNYTVCSRHVSCISAICTCTTSILHPTVIPSCSTYVTILLCYMKQAYLPLFTGMGGFPWDTSSMCSATSSKDGKWWDMADPRGTPRCSPPWTESIQRSWQDMCISLTFSTW